MRRINMASCKVISRWRYEGNISTSGLLTAHFLKRLNILGHFPRTSDESRRAVPYSSKNEHEIFSNNRIFRESDTILDLRNCGNKVAVSDHSIYCYSFVF